LPFPDKELFYKEIPPSIRDNLYVIMGSRGCPYVCSYCSNSIYKELYKNQCRLRFRSPENIIEELIVAKKKYGFKMVEFMDDVLTTNRERLTLLLELYKKHITLPFTCFLHPNLVNEEVVILLKNANCHWLKIGVQSANEEYRKKYLNRYETNTDLIMAAKLCNKHKLRFSFDHILNLPGEEEEHLIEAVKVYNHCRPTIINFISLMYLPKTEIINHAITLGLLNSQDIDSIERGEDIVARSSNIDRFTHKDEKSCINISVFALFFILISVFPKTVVDYLIKKKLYNIKVKIPNFILIIFKIISKFKARQGYVYLAVIKNSLTLGLKDLFKSTR